MQLYFSGFLAGGLLICALVIILALRFLVHKRTKVDPMVTAAPFALIFSIFFVIAYGVNLFSLSIFVLVLLAFFTNYRALQRFVEGLYVDYYHSYFSIASFIEALLTIIMVVALVIYAPVPDTPSKGYSVTKTQLTGSATKGLQEKSATFERVSGILYEYQGDSGVNEEKPVLLYVPDLFCSTSDFLPILAGYARDGFRVVAADLYLDDVIYNSKFLDGKLVKPFAMRMQKTYNAEKFETRLNTYIQKKEREIKTLKEFVENKYPEKEILFLGDTYTSEAAKNLFFKENIIKYDWGGCGLLSQTLPLEYKVFSVQR